MTGSEWLLEELKKDEVGKIDKGCLFTQEANISGHHPKFSVVNTREIVVNKINIIPSPEGIYIPVRSWWATNI